MSSVMSGALSLEVVLSKLECTIRVQLQSNRHVDGGCFLVWCVRLMMCILMRIMMGP